MTETTQRYYIAVPDNKKYGYQTIPTWKNYSYTGTLFEAQEKAIELFIKAGYLENDMLTNLSEFYLDTNPFGDEKYLDTLEELWETDNDIEKNKHLKKFYDSYLKYHQEECNRGLILWDNVDNENKRNIYSNNLHVIEIE